MYVLRNIVALSPNHCCSGKATMSSVFLVDLHVTFNNVKKTHVARKCFYEEFLSQAVI